MDLLFASSDLHETCSRRRAMRKRWGPAQAEVIAQRLQELDAADRLGDLALLPYLRLVPAGSGRVVTLHDGDGVRIRLRPQRSESGRGTGDAWRECSEVVVLDVDVSAS